MTKSVFTQPSPEQLNAFVSGDPIAMDEVVSLLLPQLYRWAIKQYDNLPADEIQSTVNLVFAEVCRNHRRYEPQKSQLTTYVIKLLKLRLADLYHETYKGYETENLSLDEYEKLLQKPYNITDHTNENDTSLTRKAFFEGLALILDTHEYEVLAHILKGEKRQEIFVSILKNCGFPISNPSHDVKNVKERLFRRLRILAEDSGYSLLDLLD